MLLFIVSAAAVVFFTTLRIIGYNFKKVALTETMESNDNQAIKYASIIQSALENDFDKIRAYKHIVEGSTVLTYAHRRPLFDETLKQIARRNANYTAVWDTWELRFTDPNWTMPHGRVSRSFFHDEYNNIGIKIDSLDLEDDDFESMYYMYKLVPEEAITNPYPYSYTGLKKDEVLETSILVPLNIGKQFAGLTGIDIELSHFQQFIDSINLEQPFDVMFFAFNGDIVAHPNKTFVGQNIVVVDTFLSKKFNILDHIQSGVTSNYILKDKNGIDSAYYTLASFTVGNTNTPWAILISAPLNQIESQFEVIYKVLSKATIIGLLVLTLVVLIFSLSIVFPIRKTRNILNKLSFGEVEGIDKLNFKSKDEIGEMANSVNTVVEGLNRVTDFAKNIGDGNFDYKFEALNKDDVLGQAVIEMRNSLKKARDEEEFRTEEARQLEWASQGMNIFNRVLRVDNRSLENLTYEIVKTLTIYLDAHMGGIYVKSEGQENEFELISFLGFNKDKYENKYIRPDESLVGQCILEKETIFVNDVPLDSDVISSGLGKSIPRSILVVPLLSNRKLIGLIELESLKQIQQYHINFVERIAETIASTVATVKTNEQTAQLLNKSQKQAEELEQQEEEMRQNMEEMQATQEEASKREFELGSLIEGFKQVMPVLEYSKEGKVIDVNENYLKIYKTQKNQIIGKRHKADSFMNESDQIKHSEFWNNLADGQELESLEYIRSGKDDYWFIEKFVPIKDQYGLVQKILCIGIDVTEQQKTESKIKQIQEGIIKSKSNLSSSPSSTPIIDLDQKLKSIDLTYLSMVYKKDPAKIYNILNLYYDTLPSQVKEVEELVKQKDYKKLKPRINSLKTKMSYLGLKKIYEQIRGVEKLLNEEKNLAEIDGMSKTIIKDWIVAYEELRNILRIPGRRKK